MLRSLLLLLCVLAAMPARAAERVMVGYFATFGDLPVEQIPWNRLTHVCHAYLRVDAEGELVTTDAMPNGGLTADGRKNGVPVLVTIGGGVTVRGLEKVTVDKKSTTALLREVLRNVNEGRYDGVDLDWEFPRDEVTRTGHARLVSELRRGLDALAKRTQREKPYLLTATLTAAPFFGQWVDVEAIVPKVDWLNIKAYDMAGPWSQYAAHHAPLFASSDDPEKATRSVAGAMRYWEGRGVPKSKLVLGTPLFGRAMPAAKRFDVLDEDLAKRHRPMSFTAIRKLVGEGWLAEWDNEARAPWLSKPTPKDPPKALSPLTAVDPSKYDGPVIVGYDDRNSTHMKATWAQEQGYRGVSFWAIHQDRMSDGQHWLLDAANTAWPAE